MAEWVEVEEMPEGYEPLCPGCAVRTDRWVTVLRNADGAFVMPYAAACAACGKGPEGIWPVFRIRKEGKS